MARHPTMGYLKTHLHLTRRGPDGKVHSGIFASADWPYRLMMFGAVLFSLSVVMILPVWALAENLGWGSKTLVTTAFGWLEAVMLGSGGLALMCFSYQKLKERLGR